MYVIRGWERNHTEIISPRTLFHWIDRSAAVFHNMLLAIAICLCLVACSRCVSSLNSRFDSLHNRTFEAFGSLDQALETIKHSLVCTDPNAKLFGGFGNFMYTVYGVQAVALITGRVSVMNHLLFTSMFHHPDPRQSWDLIAQDHLKGLQQTVLTRSPRCPDILLHPLQKIPPKYGINGCLHAFFEHKEGSAILTRLLPLRFNVSDVSFADQVSGDIAQWSLSRPTPSWQRIVAEAKAKIFDPCGPGVNHADLAIQYRTWRDLHSEDLAASECHQQCANEMALDVQKHLNRPICVFVTSDNETTTATLASTMNALSPANITAVYFHEINKQWHSAEVVASARWEFDSSTLHEHDELKIWMMLGDARYALSTAGSTYARSARLRGGSARRLGDRQTEFAHMGVGKAHKCICQRLFPQFDLDDYE